MSKYYECQKTNVKWSRMSKNECQMTTNVKKRMSNDHECQMTTNVKKPMSNDHECQKNQCQMINKKFWH